eukprot:4526284-Amphidinium_carterae.1
MSWAKPIILPRKGALEKLDVVDDGTKVAPDADSTKFIFWEKRVTGQGNHKVVHYAPAYITEAVVPQGDECTWMCVLNGGLPPKDRDGTFLPFDPDAYPVIGLRAKVSADRDYTKLQTFKYFADKSIKNRTEKNAMQTRRCAAACFSEGRLRL